MFAVRLPAEKLKKIRAEARRLRTADSTTTRKLSQFLGKLNEATRAVPVAPLFYHNFQTALSRAFLEGGQDYSVVTGIAPDMKEELQW